MTAVEELIADYAALEEKFGRLLPIHEFGYVLIRLAVKRLMDEAPRHMVALETIKTATEAGIKQHVEEKE